MSQNSLYSRIVKDPSKIDEIEIFLQHHFSISERTELRKIVHGNQIEVQYKSDSREISDILVVGDISDEQLDKLEQEIDDQVFADHGNDVRVVPIFTGPRVVGKVRVGNDFQIIPVPEAAPKLHRLLGDHPALLEFVYQKSPNMPINQHRSAKRQRELVGLLNVLIQGGVSDYSNTVNHVWVLDVSFSQKKPTNMLLKIWKSIIQVYQRWFPQTWTSVWRQTGYVPGVEWDDKDEFGFSTNENWNDIPRKEPTDYYSSGYSITNRFHFPANFEKSVDRYFKLDFDEQKLFQRAAQLVAKSSDIYYASQSLSYSALVFALEVLMEPRKMIKHCDACNQDKYDKSIMKRFKELLQLYGARLSNAYVNEMYGIRSSIAHGEDLLPRDREGSGFGFNVEGIKKDEAFRRLRLVCMVVLFNWLHSDARTEKG